jgi:hypothetical protein
MALGHTTDDKVEAGDQRGGLFKKRRRLMNAWADGPTYANVPSPARVGGHTLTIGMSKLLSWLGCSTIRSFIDSPTVSTAGYVKLLLPPRQSRGNSHWGLETTTRSSW